MAENTLAKLRAKNRSSVSTSRSSTVCWGGVYMGVRGNFQKMRPRINWCIALQKIRHNAIWYTQWQFFMYMILCNGIFFQSEEINLFHKTIIRNLYQVEPNICSVPIHFRSIAYIFYAHIGPLPHCWLKLSFWKFLMSFFDSVPFFCVQIGSR